MGPKAHAGWGRALRRGLATPAVCAALLAGLLGGCGSNDTEVRSEDVNNRESLAIVRSSQIEATPAGSPERAVLRWWRFMQFRSSTDALDLWAPEVRERLRESGDYQNQVFRYFSPWLQHVRVEIVDVERSGTRATVNLRTTFLEPVGADLIRRRTEFTAIPLVRPDEQWQLADSAFFEEQTQFLKEFDDEQREQQDRPPVDREGRSQGDS